eukprot:scaffold533159_cov16-Prasinocladus_malaysianus.AAC.1
MPLCRQHHIFPFACNTITTIHCLARHSWNRGKPYFGDPAVANCRRWRVLNPHVPSQQSLGAYAPYTVYSIVATSTRTTTSREFLLREFLESEYSHEYGCSPTLACVIDYQRF